MIYTSERKMKFNFARLWLLALICMVSASIAMAVPTCPSTTLANGVPPPAYENADGSTNGYVCDFGGLEFSNFSSMIPGGLPPASVGVSPGFQPGTTPPNTNPGFLFNGPFHVDNGGIQDVMVSFTVTALTGLLTDVHIQLDNSFVTGTGNVSYTEQVCLSTINCALFIDNPNGNLISDLVLTTPQKSITISKDLILSAGANGTATMSGFSNFYSHTSEVPEPRAVSALLGLGFFGIMAFMKRRQAVRS
jgi:hypothetical protein